jgi:hypothetical protein
MSTASFVFQTDLPGQTSAGSYPRLHAKVSSLSVLAVIDLGLVETNERKVAIIRASLLGCCNVPRQLYIVNSVTGFHSQPLRCQGLTLHQLVDQRYYIIINLNCNFQLQLTVTVILARRRLFTVTTEA